MSCIFMITVNAGADLGFPVGGGHTQNNWKLLAYFVWKNHDFKQKNHIFSNFRGCVCRVLPPPWIRPWYVFNSVKKGIDIEVSIEEISYIYKNSFISFNKDIIKKLISTEMGVGGVAIIIFDMISLLKIFILNLWGFKHFFN